MARIKMLEFGGDDQHLTELSPMIWFLSKLGEPNGESISTSTAKGQPTGRDDFPDQMKIAKSSRINQRSTVSKYPFSSK